jgi:hypothetical protein
VFGGGLSELHQNTLEVALRDMLLGSKDYRQTAESLFQRLQSEDYETFSERQVFVRFLIQAGFFAQAFELYANWFAEKKNIPLYEFCYLLHSAGIEPPLEFHAQIEQAHQDLGKNSNLTHFLPWQKSAPFWQQLLMEANRKTQNQQLQRKKDMLDRLEYFRLNRMIEEEERLLRQLQAEFPDDQSLAEQAHNFHERWARAIIAKKAIEKFDAQMDIVTTRLNKYEIEFVKVLVGDLKDLASMHPEMAYDFALCLCFMELYEPARELLEMAPSTIAVDWLYLDVLLKCRRYAEGLDALLTLERRYANNPETTFATTYARAQALAGLGQMGAAAALLKSLVGIRPGYRSAHLLLLQWGART